MFIELTDHLRCPGDHDEGFLVLLPDAMNGRLVARGTLGCPSCGKLVNVVDGVVDFGGGPNSPAETQLTADLVALFLGLEGPGGYLALIGAVGLAAPACSVALPGIRLVLVNPPAGVADSDAGSVVRAARSPLKSNSMRGVVLSADHGADPAWVNAAFDAVLPGNPVVIEGGRIERSDVAIVAEAPGFWVGRKTTGRWAP